jgi:hypothetical protein
MVNSFENYARDGFAVVDGFAEVMNLVKRRFHQILSQFMSGVPPLENEPAFAAWVIDAYRIDKSRLMTVYAVLDRSFEMITASVSSPVRACLAGVGLGDPVLSSYPTWRLDVGDNPERRWFPWHQEKYHREFSDTGVTIWVPMHAVGDAVPCQTIHVKPGSHRFGTVQYGESKFDIIDPRVADMPEVPVRLEFGQGVVFSNFLIHRSGVITDPAGLRMSLQLRYDDLADEEYKGRGWPANYRIVDVKDPNFFQRYSK